MASTTVLGFLFVAFLSCWVAQCEKTLIIAESEAAAASLKALITDKTVEVQTTSGVTFQKYGEYQFDNLILFGASGDVQTSQLLDFVDSNHNVIVVAKADGSSGDALAESLREAAIECGVYFSDTNVVDNFHNAGKNSRITTDRFAKAVSVFPKPPAEITYHGLGIQLEKNNPLLIPFATARPTAFTPVEEDEDDDTPFAVGTNIALAAGLQTRAGSRIGFIGSTELFTDGNAANTAFVKNVVEWTLGYRGVLRHSNIHFDKLSGEHRGFRIRDQLSYSVKIEERVNGKWVPFKTDDIQLEFTMIDPYVRQSLQYDTKANDGTYTLTFQAPDVYGIFKFNVDYRRAGYSLLSFSNQATVRPLRLNEYERFIPAAYPYYAGVFSCYAAFFLFVLFIVNSQ